LHNGTLNSLKEKSQATKKQRFIEQCTNQTRHRSIVDC